MQARIGFDRDWYLKEYPDVNSAGVNPVYHYILHGKSENRSKSQRHKDQKEWWQITFKALNICYSWFIFDKKWYLENYPDVANTGDDPWRHYIKKGRHQERYRNKEDKHKFDLKESAKAADIFLCKEEVSDSAAPEYLQDIKSSRSESGSSLLSNPIVDVEIYVSSLGNYFFKEMAALLAAGFSEAGITCRVKTEQDSPTFTAKKYLVIAPHEFFFLGKGKVCFDRSFQGRLILLNTEQIHTRWFALASQTFSLAEHILDINADNVHELCSRGIPATHFRFGFVKKFELYDGRLPLAFGPKTDALGEAVRKWKDLDHSLAERPLDLCFFGEATARRCKLLAKFAPILQQFECYLYLKPKESSLQLAESEGMSSGTSLSVGIARRSKIMLNLHRSTESYFEWHRIVLMGLWQRALVITEPVGSTTPFKSGRDFIELPAGEICSRLKYYLLDPRGIAEAERIRNQGHQSLKDNCEFAPHLLSIYKNLFVSR